jgi:hypothetical protein
MTDKQLLQLSKVELVAKYRELEAELKVAKESTIKEVKTKRNIYEFGG